MKRYFGVITFSFGIFILLLTLAYFLLMQNYDFYLGVINTPMTSDFGGVQMQITIYGLGFFVSLVLMLIGWLLRTK